VFANTHNFKKKSGALRGDGNALLAGSNHRDSVSRGLDRGTATMRKMLRFKALMNRRAALMAQRSRVGGGGGRTKTQKVHTGLVVAGGLVRALVGEGSSR